jgi:hypothetical protein
MSFREAWRAIRRSDAYALLKRLLVTVSCVGYNIRTLSSHDQLHGRMLRPLPPD